MLETFETHGLRQEPFFECLFGQFQTLPVVGDIGHQLAFGWDVGRAIRQTQLGLKGVEVGFQLRLLLNTWWLMLAAISTVLLQFLLDAGQRVVGLTSIQPWRGTANPVEKLIDLQKKSSMFNRPRTAGNRILFDLRVILTSLARRSYSSMRRSFSWLTFKTLQIRLAAVSACDGY